MEYTSFKKEYLPKAAELLSKRHMYERKRFPGLSDKFENFKQALKSLDYIWNKEYTEGIAAFRKDKLVGYIIGHVNTDSKYFKRHAWVDYEGLAIDRLENPELYRNLYSKIGEKWVKYGCFNHFVMVPSGNSKVIDTWLKLGFAYQQAHGLYKIEEEEKTDLNNIDIEIRHAVKSDLEDIKNISNLIFKYQTRSPIWAVGLPEDAQDLEDGYIELIEDDQADFWLAFKKGKLVGFQCFRKKGENQTNMMIPEKSIELIVAGTIQKERKHGIGSLLVKHGFHNAKRKGFNYCITDWRITNLLSSNFWPKKGFQEIAYRFIRTIDHRILWANGINRINK